MKILIADDKAMMRDLLKHTLRSVTNIECVEANNGIEAVNLYKKFKPDIVFLDINMPPSNGITALKEIKAIDKNSFIVIVSAENSIINVKYALKSGADGFIAKPYNGQRVIDIINKFRSH